MQISQKGCLVFQFFGGQNIIKSDKWGGNPFALEGEKALNANTARPSDGQMSRIERAMRCRSASTSNTRTRTVW